MRVALNKLVGSTLVNLFNLTESGQRSDALSMPTTVSNSHPFNHPDVGQISDNSDGALQMTQDLEKDDNFYYTKRFVDRCFRLVL